MYSIYKRVDEHLYQKFGGRVNSDHSLPPTSSGLWPLILEIDLCDLARKHGVNAVKKEVERFEEDHAVKFHFSWARIMEDVVMRSNWEMVLRSVDKNSSFGSIGMIAFNLSYRLTSEDMLTLINFHEKDVCRKEIEELLTECNFRGFYDDLVKGSYENARRQVLNAD